MGSFPGHPSSWMTWLSSIPLLAAMKTSTPGLFSRLITVAAQQRPRERGLQDTPDLKSDPPAMSSQSYLFLTVVPQAGYLHCVPLFPSGEVGL